MAWEENSCICLNMQLIAILSRIGVWSSTFTTSRPSGDTTLFCSASAPVDAAARSKTAREFLKEIFMRFLLLFGLFVISLQS